MNGFIVVTLIALTFWLYFTLGYIFTHWNVEIRRLMIEEKLSHKSVVAHIFFPLKSLFFKGHKLSQRDFFLCSNLTQEEKYKSILTFLWPLKLTFNFGFLVIFLLCFLLIALFAFFIYLITFPARKFTNKKAKFWLK